MTSKSIWNNYNYTDYINVSKLEINKLPSSINVSTMSSTCNINTIHCNWTECLNNSCANKQGACQRGPSETKIIKPIKELINNKHSKPEHKLIQNPLNKNSKTLKP